MEQETRFHLDDLATWQALAKTHARQHVVNVWHRYGEVENRPTWIGEENHCLDIVTPWRGGKPVLLHASVSTLTTSGSAVAA